MYHPMLPGVLRLEREREMTRRVQVAQRNALVLRTGHRARVRAFQPEDRSAVRAFFDRLSSHSLAQRFHSAGAHISDVVLDMVTTGHVLIVEMEGAIVALASYRPRSDQGHADAAMVVEDDVQGSGIGWALAHRLTCDARLAGVHRLHASVQSSNHKMLKLLDRINLPMTRTVDHGLVEIEIEVVNAPCR